MIFLFALFAAALCFFSYKSWRGGQEYLNFFSRELAAAPPSDFSPTATVIAPCRGLDAGLEANLSALFRQNYSPYEVLFVVDSEADEAVSVIRKIIDGKHSETTPERSENSSICRAKLIVAGKTAGESQKVHNLREAVLHAARESEIFVFVDSDARPAENWLRHLIAPLRDEKNGASTGYRWFISKKITFGSEMRAVWNASIASALGANRKNNFCWGGSMALRRATFEQVGMRELWKGTLSDDFAVTRAMHENGLEIAFVPQALTASVESCSLRECLEFTTRQMKITRVYAPHLWKMSFTGAALFNLVLVWGLLNLFAYAKDSAAFWFSLGALALVAVFSAGKSFLRLKAVRLVLRNYESELKKQFWTQNTLWVLSPALFFYNSFCALISRRITWRGIVYRLVSPSETKVLSISGAPESVVVKRKV